MKKNLLWLFIFLGFFIVFGRCNNNREPENKTYRTDTIRDTIKVKDTIHNPYEPKK